MRWLLLAVAWLATIGFVGFLVLSPTSDTPNAWLYDWIHWLGHRGVPSELTRFDTWEFLANVALFAPIGLLARATVPEIRAWGWLLLGFLLGGSVELFQAALHPARDANLRDVFANGLGVGLGALAFEVVALAWSAGASRRAGVQYTRI